MGLSQKKESRMPNPQGCCELAVTAHRRKSSNASWTRYWPLVRTVPKKTT